MPGFGSCHLRLRKAARERATVVFGDSAARPAEIGLTASLAPVVAPLLESMAAGGSALGRGGVGVRELAEGAIAGDLAAGRGAFEPAMTRDPTGYAEAQVHGLVSLADDVEAVVIDPAFDHTPAGEALVATAGRWGFEVEWHEGAAMDFHEVPDEAPTGAGLWRWQEFCADGRARLFAEVVVARHGVAPRLDAGAIGRAAAELRRDPERWRDWGMEAEVRDHLKDLWVIAVAHGGPAVGSSD